MLKKIIDIIKIILFGLMGYLGYMIFRNQKPKPIKIELGKIKVKHAKAKKTKFTNDQLDKQLADLKKGLKK